MYWIKRSSHFRILAGLLALVLAIAVSARVQAQMPPSSPLSSIPSQWEPPSGTGTPDQREAGATRGGPWVPPSGTGAPDNRQAGATRGSGWVPPSGTGTPDNRQGGATRGPLICPGDEPLATGNKELTALIPKYSVGKTIAAHPTFSWYVPPTLAKAVEFVLFDEKKEEEIYSTRLAIAARQPGIISLQLPASANLLPLQVGKEYSWEFALVCNSLDRSADTWVEGKIQRVQPNPDLVSKIQQANPQQRVALYAQNKLWYETVAALVELRRLNPNDPTLAEAWEKLLASVELNDLAKEPLAQGGTENPSS